MTTMKVKGMIMVAIMMLCIPINAQMQSDKTLVAYFRQQEQRRKLLS